MFILMLLIIGVSVPTFAEAQIFCSQLGGGTTVCDSASGSTSITELSRGQGIITQQGRNGSSSMEPYTIIGQDNRRSSYSSDRLPELERLPSSSSYGSSERSSTFEERQAIRDSGRIPW